MKIIHCADIHLDSPFKRLGSPEKIRERKAELIKAFTDMVKYASENGVSVILIAGDLFDQSKVSARSSNAVLGAILNNPDVDFYYIKGNHDKSDFLEAADDIPQNLHLFTDSWTSYDLGENIVLTGVELTKDNADSVCGLLSLDSSKCNIVTLHGQDSYAAVKDNAQVINIKELQNKYIDYLALGHVHSYKFEKLDNRGVYCYPGCLEARGFDETGSHGFMVLDIDGPGRSLNSITKECHPIRTPHVLSVDITGKTTTSEIINRIEEELAAANCPAKDLVKIELTGELDIDCEKNITYIEKEYEYRFYDFKLKDLSTVKIDYNVFKLDESLKGEFVRAVQADQNLSDEEKAEIIRTGINLLKGEELE